MNIFSNLWRLIQTVYFRIKYKGLRLSDIVIASLTFKTIAELLRKGVKCRCVAVDDVLKGKYSACPFINDRSNLNG